jgi:hypothetical protein
VTHLPRRARGLLIALAILALSAGAAVAARPVFTTPDAAAGGLERATDASGVSVPVAGAPTESAPEVTEEEPTEAPSDAPEVDGAAVTADHPDNHGATVSQAAQAETPAEFDNHGQYVKSVATDNHGHDPERVSGKEKAEQSRPSR